MTENYLTNITPDSITGLILGFEGIRNSLVILNGPTGCKFFHSITAENQSVRKDDYDPLNYPDEWFFGQRRPQDPVKLVIIRYYEKPLALEHRPELCDAAVIFFSVFRDYLFSLLRLPEVLCDAADPCLGLLVSDRELHAKELRAVTLCEKLFQYVPSVVFICQQIQFRGAEIPDRIE